MFRERRIIMDKIKLSEYVNRLQGDQTLTKLSKKTNINISTLSKIKNMRIDKPPSVQVLSKLGAVNPEIVSYSDLMQAAGFFSDSTSEEEREKAETLGYLYQLECIDKSHMVDVNRAFCLELLNRGLRCTCIFDEFIWGNLKIIFEDQVDQWRFYFDIRAENTALRYHSLLGKLASMKHMSESARYVIVVDANDSKGVEQIPEIVNLKCTVSFLLMNYQDGVIEKEIVKSGSDENRWTYFEK